MQKIQKVFEDSVKSGNSVVLVAEDKLENNIIGSASLLVEQKFLRNLGKAGHIEDVVVDQSARGRGVGKRLI